MSTSSVLLRRDWMRGPRLTMTRSTGVPGSGLFTIVLSQRRTKRFIRIWGKEAGIVTVPATSPNIRLVESDRNSYKSRISLL